MKRIDRLKEIERLWKRRQRIEPWETLKWEADVRDDKNVDPTTVEKTAGQLKYLGHVIEVLDGSEIEVSETPWDTFLLDCLRIWYYLSESCNAPLFVNEEAYAVAIADFAPERFDLLFYHPASVVLGLANWEKVIRESNAQTHESKKAARQSEQPSSSRSVGSQTPVSAAEALHFLTQ